MKTIETGFKFLDVGTLSDGEIELVVKERIPADDKKGYVPGYEFEIRLAGKQEPIGRVGLRIGKTRRITKYVGHIGYGINEPHRGHHYAAKSCNLIKSVAFAHGLRTVWITCDPSNIASRRTCELIGCKLIEIVDVPEDNDLFKVLGARVCRYKWDLRGSQHDLRN